MSIKRLQSHPILDVPSDAEIPFFWNGKAITGRPGEMIASALFANDIHVFGHHHKDGSPQGLFCANGQCSQCLVMADGIPVKACMTPLKKEMAVQSVTGLPSLPEKAGQPVFNPATVQSVAVLIIGGGPAGLSAAIELGRLGIETLIIDDKDRMGGKLVLQTHKFFGSVDDSHAGTRGFEIASILEAQLREFPSVQTWLESTAVGVFSDGVVGVVKKNRYRQIRPKKLLVATGAREKCSLFPATRCPAYTVPGRFRPWSIGI